MIIKGRNCVNAIDVYFVGLKSPSNCRVHKNDKGYFINHRGMEVLNVPMYGAKRNSLY